MVKETKRRQSVHVDGGSGDRTPMSPIRLPPHLCLRPEPPHPRPHPRMPPHFRPPLPEPSRRLPISDLRCRGRCLHLHAVASACLPIFGPLCPPPPRLRSVLLPSPPPPPRTASACLPIFIPLCLEPSRRSPSQICSAATSSRTSSPPACLPISSLFHPSHRLPISDLRCRRLHPHAIASAYLPISLSPSLVL